jgi:predicted SnoaL-like aldol condensation-catalyzing enzyme
MADEVLISAYWRHYELAGSPDRAERLTVDDGFWAWEQVHQSVLDGRAGIVDLLVELSDAAPNDRGLAYLGAGPIENLLVAHGSEVVDEIEERCRSNERFRIAVRCAWFDELPSVARLRKFGPPL